MERPESMRKNLLMGDEKNDFLKNVTSALPLAGAVFNPIMQGVQNRKQRKWEEKMAQRQRDWSLEDWNRTNTYNSPVQQMQRLKDAGLNPNLVYGNGAEGNAAGMPRASSTGSWSPKAPEFEGSSVLGAYTNTELQRAQIELVRANTAVREKDSNLRDLEFITRALKNSSLKLGLKRDTELYNTSVDVVKQRLENMKSQHDLMGAQQSLTAGKSYEQSMKNLYWDKTLSTQVDLLRQKYEQGKLNLQKTVEQSLLLVSQRLKNGFEINKINALISQIQSATSLNEVTTRLREFDLQTASKIGSNVIGAIINKVLK